MVRLQTWALSAFAGVALAALQVDLDSPASIKAAAALVADDLLTFYRGDEPGFVPGILPGPPPDGDYYWWQGGAMWGTLLDYWHSTGDSKHNGVVKQALLHQVGDDRDYMPANWSASMGNDDQAFWGLSAMLAAEYAFEDPPAEDPQWLALVQAIFNEQSSLDRRVTDGNCNGGLRWQVFPSNQGYNYINTIANACYFNIGARLARYTNNETYAAAATRTWEFMERVAYIDQDYNVYDGAHLPNCTDVNRAQFSYNAAMILQGAAFLYNHTNGAAVWEQRIGRLLNQTLGVFFPNGTAFEIACETTKTCNTDMKSFKGYLHRWLASTALLAPFTRAAIVPMLRSSAAAAVAQCTGGDNGRMCGFYWSTGAFDGQVGAGQQMNVLGALSSLLLADAGVPLTNTTGGTSVGDVNAGNDNDLSKLPHFDPITAADRAGAAILTILFVVGAGSMFWVMSTV